MNKNIILLCYLLIKNKKNNLLNLDNYFWKLSIILKFNILSLNQKKN
jgi:hypothetical protein